VGGERLPVRHGEGDAGVGIAPKGSIAATGSRRGRHTPPRVAVPKVRPWSLDDRQAPMTGIGEGHPTPTAAVLDGTAFGQPSRAPQGEHQAASVEQDDVGPRTVGGFCDDAVRFTTG
jgi:hypothetical protein